MRIDVEEPPGPRADILHCISENPGIHLRNIARATQLPLGQVTYHLDRLARRESIVAAKDHGFKRYFMTGSVPRDARRHIAALRHDTPRAIAVALLHEPERMHKDLVASVGVAPSTLTFHLQRLVAARVVERQRDEHGAARYTLADPGAIQRALAEFGASFHDPRVEHYLAEVASQHVDP